MARRNEVTELRKLREQHEEIARKMDEAKAKAALRIGDEMGKLLGVDGAFDVIEMLRKKSSGSTPAERTERLVTALSPPRSEPANLREAGPREPVQQARPVAS